MEPAVAAVWRPIEEQGYLFVRAPAMRRALERVGSLSDWPRFAASWNDLDVDRYLQSGGRYRTRRYAVYTASPRAVVERQAHQAHYQQLEYNPLFGGVERWFAPIEVDIGGGPTMLSVLRFCHEMFGELAPNVARWHVEAHQFRIEARADLPGQPTPEGAHRDGVDFVLVLLVNRENIVSGATTVYDPAGTPLGTFTLTDPFDSAFVDDRRVAHGVTPVTPLNPARPGCRDVLVVTFRRLRD